MPRPAYNGGPVGRAWLLAQRLVRTLADARVCGLFDARLRWLRETGNADLIRRGLRGIEKESLRVDTHGRLSRRDHPRALGAALTHPYLTTDYSEALLEFVTPAYRSSWETLQFLCDMHSFVHRRLDGELLWPASMPCVIEPDEEIPIARYGRSNAGMMKTVYRRGLGYRYGRAMQAIAGAHFNFSMSDRFWEAYAEFEPGSTAAEEFRSARYMGLVRNYRRHGWLVTYLFGASPALCKSFKPEGSELLEQLDPATWYAPYATSLRMSDLGYRNKTQDRLSISANSLHAYIDGLVSAVTTVDPAYRDIGVVVDGEYRQLNACILQIENEYYSPIRPKPSKDTHKRPTAALRNDGIEYVEVRSLDLNAADPVGVNQSALRFLEALLIYCVLAESPPIDAAEQKEINERDLLVAREGRRPGLALRCGGRSVPLREAGLELTARVAEVADLLDAQDEGYRASVAAQREALADADATPSARLVEALQRERLGFFAYTLALAERHRQYFAGLPLDPAKDDYFASLAADSVRHAEVLEDQAEPPFDEFLSAWFADV